MHSVAGGVRDSFCHAAINNTMQHALKPAGVPSQPEPSGLLQSDGRNPDGVSIMPWSVENALFESDLSRYIVRTFSVHSCSPGSWSSGTAGWAVEAFQVYSLGIPIWLHTCGNRDFWSIWPQGTLFLEGTGPSIISGHPRSKLTSEHDPTNFSGSTKRQHSSSFGFHGYKCRGT